MRLDLRKHLSVQILGFVNRVQDVEATVDLDRFTMAEVESNAVRCPDTDAAERMYDGTNSEQL